MRSTHDRCRRHGTLCCCGAGTALIFPPRTEMASRKHAAEQKINGLKEAEVAIAEGSAVAEPSYQIGVAQQTFHRWRAECGGLRKDKASRLKRLESENSRLRRVVVDPKLDNQTLGVRRKKNSKPFTSELACEAIGDGAVVEVARLRNPCRRLEGLQPGPTRSVREAMAGEASFTRSMSCLSCCQWAK